MDSLPPLILTLRLSEEAFTFFNTLRQTYFPPERNFLSAHLTLFHHLPAGESRIVEDLAELAQQQQQIRLQTVAVVSIGKGVAYKIESAHLVRLHKELQIKWQQWLTPQDKQKLWPHITVQNKVSPAVAQQTLSVLMNSFQPFEAIGTGFDLWRYDGGPWSFLQYFPFKT
ncbi:MAG TPA: 2'-5' RNA ligase family protein [Flavisolibacter sp.]|nr:2'-5' RNA ligase family protein [Flavisolibacter sp.]